MPGRKFTLFGREVELPENSGFSSTSTNRDTLLLEGGTEILDYMLENYYGALKLPQGIMSLFILSCDNTHISEKLIHLLLAATAFAHFGIFTAIFFQDVHCDIDDDSLCDGQFYLKLVYGSLFLLTQAVSNFSKDPIEPVTSNRVSNERDLEEDIVRDEEEDSENNLGNIEATL